MDNLTKHQKIGAGRTDLAFIEGVAWALATLNKLHDLPGACADVIAESGLRVEDFREVDGFDGMEIRKIFRKEAFRIGDRMHKVRDRGYTRDNR